MKRRTQNLHLGWLIILGLGGIGVVIGGARSAGALTYQSSAVTQFTFGLDSNLAVSVSGDLRIDDLSPGSVADSNVITVGVNTNNATGYSLSATVGDSSNATTSLRHSDSGVSSSFSSLATTASYTSLSDAGVSDNSWGYSYSLDGGSSWVSAPGVAGYSGLPIYTGNGKTLKTTDAPGISSILFKMGAKSAKTQASGTYTNVVNFTAVTNAVPLTLEVAYAEAGKSKITVGGNQYYTLQDMNSSICSAAEMGSTLTVADVRDNNVYNIGKLKDGKCWLLDNLRLNPVTVSLADLKGNTNATDQVLTYLKNGGGSSPYPASGVSSGWTSSSQNSYNLPYVGIGTGTNNKPTAVASDSLSQSGGWTVGVFYNYCAASAGSYCYASGAGVDKSDTAIDAPYDICPANWRMPTGGAINASTGGGEYRNLYNQYTSDAEGAYTAFRKALHIPLSGGFDSGTVYSLGSYGLCWSSTYRDASDMYRLSANTSSIYPQDRVDRYYGLSVRCLAQ